MKQPALQWLAERWGRGRPEPPWHGIEGPLHAFRCEGTAVDDLPPADDSGAAPLPDALVIEPGIYRVHETSFRLTDSGVYRFYALGGATAQRLVAPARLIDALGAIGWLWRYGTEDEAAGADAVWDQLRTRRVAMQCTNLSRLCTRLLESLGFEARRVLMMTRDALNGYDNGHALIETREPGGSWLLYDPSFQCAFPRDGIWLGAAQLVDCARGGSAFEIQRLSGGEISEQVVVDGRDFGFWMDHRLGSKGALRAWYERMAGVPLIQGESGQWFFPGDESTHRRLVEYGLADLHRLDPPDFERRFYGS